MAVKETADVNHKTNETFLSYTAPSIVDESHSKQMELVSGQDSCLSCLEALLEKVFLCIFFSAFTFCACSVVTALD